jgi:hypothetical protein
MQSFRELLGVTTMAFLMALIAAGCGGGGGTGDAALPGDEEPSNVVSFSIGAAQTSLGQEPMSVDLAPVVGVASADNRFITFSAESFFYPSGPDSSGDALPRITGDFDTQTSAYNPTLNSKLWLDLPVSAGAYQMGLEVIQVLLSGKSLAKGEPTAGVIVITPRQAYADLGGRIRLKFNATPTPVCLGWDSDSNGSYETESCLAIEAFQALWQSPQPGLPLPMPVQRAASATYAGWKLFYEQFDFSVGALDIAESNYAALEAAAANTTAVSVPCSVYPPTGTAGSYAMGWVDRNGSGRFDTGDDIRFDAANCWNRLDEELVAGAGQIINGVFELRGYERNVGAAPTFNSLHLTETLEIGGIITPQNTILVGGGFSLQAPGITASTGSVGAYHFTPENMVAAASVAAKSMEFYPDIGDLAYKAMDALQSSTAASQVLQLCRNSGSSTLAFTEGPAPHASGLSEADKARLTLVNCDLGTAVNPKIMDGYLDLTLWGVTLGPAPDWSMVANARLDLQTATTQGSSRRTGEFGMSVNYGLGHSYQVKYRPDSYSNSETLSGVLTGIEDGRLSYQVGCFDASYYTATWDLSGYHVLPNSVIKAGNKVLTIGMRMGEQVVFIREPTRSYPDAGLSGLLSISAPECVALGVPANGVSGGETRMIFDTWPNGDGDKITLGLFDQSNALIKETITSWAQLLE